MSLSGDSGSSSTSIPAFSADTQLLAPCTEAPFMASPSLHTIPSKFSFSFSSPVTIAFDSDEGVPELSSSGTLRCPTIIPDIPLSMYILNGSMSTLSSCDRVWVMVGSALCESTLVSPCPGKCFPVVSTPCCSIPCANAVPSVPTLTGSSPKERNPITGFLGLELTSSTGAKSTCMPKRRHSRATSVP